jgi:ATP-dependent Clp protease ATP-binding subunit ClpA
MGNFLDFYADRLAESALRVFESAFEESLHRQQNGISYGHILKALKDKEPELLNKTLANLKSTTLLTDNFLDSFIEESRDYYGRMGLSPYVADVCRTAMNVAGADNRRKIESADLVKAIELMVLAVAPWLREH